MRHGITSGVPLKMRRWYGVRVYGYVVMPEHVHLLVSEPKRFNLDAAIQSLKRAVASGSVIVLDGAAFGRAHQLAGRAD